MQTLCDQKITAGKWKNYVAHVMEEDQNVSWNGSHIRQRN